MFKFKKLMSLAIVGNIFATTAFFFEKSSKQESSSTTNTGKVNNTNFLIKKPNDFKGFNQKSSNCRDGLKMNITERSYISRPSEKLFSDNKLPSGKTYETMSELDTLKYVTIPMFYEKLYFNKYLVRYKKYILNSIGSHNYYPIYDSTSKNVNYLDFKKSISLKNKNSIIWKSENSKYIPNSLWIKAFKNNLVTREEILKFFYKYIKPGYYGYRYISEGRVETQIRELGNYAKNESFRIYGSKFKTYNDLLKESASTDLKNGFTHALFPNIAPFEKRKIIQKFITDNKDSYSKNYKDAVTHIFAGHNSNGLFKIMFNPCKYSKNLSPILSANPNSNINLPKLGGTETIQYKDLDGPVQIPQRAWEKAFNASAESQNDILKYFSNYVENGKYGYFDKIKKEWITMDIDNKNDKISNYKGYYEELIADPNNNFDNYVFNTKNSLYLDALENSWHNEGVGDFVVNKNRLKNYLKFEDEHEIFFRKNNSFNLEIEKYFFNLYKQNIIDTIANKKQPDHFIDYEIYNNTIKKITPKKNSVAPSPKKLIELLKPIEVSLWEKNLFSLKKGLKITDIPDKVWKELYFSSAFTQKDLIASKSFLKYINITRLILKKPGEKESESIARYESKYSNDKPFIPVPDETPIGYLSSYLREANLYEGKFEDFPGDESRIFAMGQIAFDSWKKRFSNKWEHQVPGSGTHSILVLYNFYLTTNDLGVKNLKDKLQEDWYKDLADSINAQIKDLEEFKKHLDSKNIT